MAALFTMKTHSTSRLVVEGVSDQEFVKSLLSESVNERRLRSDQPYEPIHIHSADGVSKVLTFMKDFSTTSNYKRLGFILDADLDFADRWQIVKSNLTHAGVQNIPETPDLNGTIFNHTGVRYGVWLMPNNKDQGMLEDFMTEMIKRGDRCLPYAESVCAVAKSEHGAPYRAIHLSKAKIHTWLAWQQSPGISFGQAVTDKLFISNTASVRSFVAWFKRLFIDP